MARQGYSKDIQNPKDISLEERIERIIHTPKLELDGNAYKDKYDLNNENSIKKYLIINFRDNIINEDTGSKIRISNASAGKLAGHKGEIYRKSLAYISEIIKHMKFLYETAPEKPNSSYQKYSYYITEASIDGNPYTILSTVGKQNNEFYYDQNLFEGTNTAVFNAARNSTDNKYSRLNKILENVKESDWRQVPLRNELPPTTSTNNIINFPRKSKI